MLVAATSFTSPLINPRKTVAPAQPSAAKPAAPPQPPAKAENTQSAVAKKAAALGLKPFAEVALDARASLDAGYEQMGKSRGPAARLSGLEGDLAG